MIRLNGETITPTIFPDKTSQVWNIAQFSRFNQMNFIVWDFENEAEIMHVLQLVQLLDSNHFLVELSIPFMPYSRQDKDINDRSTFALNTFNSILSLIPSAIKITTLDIHSNKITKNRVDNISPTEQIKFAIEKSGADIVCFPDKGASEREYDIQGLYSITLSKVRDQSNGNIISLAMDHTIDLRNRKVLIVDDLVDAGRTFIEAKKLLDNAGASEVSLYTSHGLYTKGIQVLRDAGFKHIFNRKGEE